MYYLPIYVNNRRMHVVKLSQTVETKLFTFLVDSSNHYDVFSLPSERIQLICDNNNGENVELLSSYFILEQLDNKDAPQYCHCENVPVFNVTICIGKGKNVIKDNADKHFRFLGNLGDTIAPGEVPFTLKALNSKSQQSLKLKDYIVQFTYKAVDNLGIECTCVGAIRICEYDNSDSIFKASLDFGSEASQIHLSTAKPEDNMNIRDAFVNIVGEDKEKDFWQGREKDNKALYKSIYHIHKEPAATNFGDMPMINKEKNFLQSLLPIDASTSDYILLPNLKLVEQLTGLLSLDNITFKEDGFMGKVDKGPIIANLTSLELSNAILRQILCNFLAIILKSEPRKKYLHFILLVPNVYIQEKVSTLVAGLYDDFNLLRKKDNFNGYKGIEVSIVSESDASFFGVRNLVGNSDLPFIKDANYLIIDAGKGTTDFSLISQKGDNLANYNSLYRSGIPASGHVLTYAFYEALRSYFHQLDCGDFFDDIMRDSVGKQPSEILNFVSLLEKFKIESKKLSEDNSMDKRVKNLKFQNNKKIWHLNTFLKNVLKEKKMIPGMPAALDEKIGEMTNLLKNSIVKYTKEKLPDTTCQKVFLTGRAFMLQQFRDAVTKMLVENGIVENDADVFYNDDHTKSICTFGAMKVGEQSVVNKNSNMLGCPHLFEQTGETSSKSNNDFFSKLKKLLKGFRRVDDGIGVDMSFEFFYEGLELRNVRNAIFSLSGMDVLLGTGHKDDLKVYYVGDGYIWKHGNSGGRIALDGRISALDNDVRNRLVKESVFPFNLVSFKLDETPTNFNSKNSNNKAPKPEENLVVVEVETPSKPYENIDALDQ